MNVANEARRDRLRKQVWATAAALLVCLLALIAGTARFAHHADQSNRESARQTELNNRTRQMQAILVALGDAETGQRGYLLTGDVDYLAPYTTAVALLPGLLKSLESIPANPSKVNSRVDAIRELARLKLAELAETIRLYDAGQQGAALALVKTDAGQGYMDEARAALNATMGEIRDDREAAVRKLTATNSAIRQWAIWIVTAIVACVLLAGVQIYMLANARRQYADVLASSEKTHRALIEQQSELVSLAREDGSLVYLNPAYARNLGVPAENITGRNLIDFVEPSDRAAVLRQIQTVFRTGTAARSENRMVSPSGEERWVSWTNSVQLGSNGEKLLHSVGRDVTQRRQTEDALRASQEFLARTGRVAGVGGWELNLVTNKVHWSEEVRHMHEVPAGFEPSLQAAIDFYAPEARALVSSAVRQAAEEGKPFDLELPLVTARGKDICVRAVGEAERGNDGRPLRLIGAIQDITERKALQDRLAESERFIRNITDSVPVRISYVDLDWRYRFVNSAQCRRFGKTREEILGRTQGELLGRPMEPGLKARAEAAFRGEPQRVEFEEVSEGTVRHIQSQLIPDVDGEGRVKGLYAIGVDITALKAAERELRDLNEILENTPDFVVQTDWKGQVQYMNPAARRALGWGPEKVAGGRSFSEFNTPQTHEQIEKEIIPAVKRHGSWLGETTVLLASHKVTPISHLVIAHHDTLGRVARFSAVMRDISGEVEGRQALRVQTATLSAVVEAIPAMVAVLDRQFRYRLVNRTFERWRGKGRAEIIGHGIAEIFGESEFGQTLPWAQKAFAGEVVHFERHYPEAHQHRNMSVSLVPLRLEDGTIEGIVGIAQDITVHREEERRLLSLSETDPLTGALNRAGFNSVLTRKCEAGGAAELALLYIDLDKFKPVNDTHGHPVGDEVLRLFVQRLQGLVRPTDAVARLGGDEFALVLAGVHSKANAEAVADKVLEVARTPFQVGNLSLSIGASVGVAFNADDEKGWKGLVERADAMVYKAKAAGRGRRL